jgi:hypothetical protein
VAAETEQLLLRQRQARDGSESASAEQEGSDSPKASPDRRLL